MKRTKKMSSITLIMSATVREYKVHIIRKLDRWKKKSCRMKNMKHVCDSDFILSTALCILSAP